ncbi:MAG: hypothetical protein ABI156_09500, partial [Caldimonas sp.]
MNDTTRNDTGWLLAGALGTLLGLAAGTAAAQDAGSAAPAAPAAPAPGAAAYGASDPNPYYLGVSQALTHDSNVFRTPNKTADTYSTTSLFGGFDQRISRQRIFGKATVGANRYMDQTRLNNNSYSLLAGLDWETIGSLSGNLGVAASQGLSSPAASGVAVASTRNLAQTESVNARIRYGGASLLSIEGALGYSKVNYDDPAYVSSESQQDTGSLGLYYHPGGPLRLGVAGRYTRTKTPKGFQEFQGGPFLPNTAKSNNLDLLADYELTGLLSTHARLSYTKQTNSGISAADFSGLTGSLGINYRPTGKLSFNLHAARDAGLNAYFFQGEVLEFGNQGPVPTRVTGQYQNSQITNVIGLNASYAATGKVNVDAGVSYSRAKLLSTVNIPQLPNQPGADTTDISKIAYIGAHWAV